MSHEQGAASSLLGSLAFGACVAFPVAVAAAPPRHQTNVSQGSSTRPSESSSDLAHFVGAGLYYTGRQDLQVGVWAVHSPLRLVMPRVLPSRTARCAA